MISRSGVKYYERIPTWRNGNWEVTEFGNREEFKSFVLDRFKEPGQYGFNEDTAIFNEQATIFNERNYFCQAPIKSKDFVNYWDDQKVKNRNGIIVISGDKTWYVCRDYYMWLNFLPIYDKEESLFGFAKVRDAQYHMALYELLAELHYKHSAILKKRQIASSYFHSAKLINQIWFEEGVTLKMGASLKDYINEKGTWKMLDEYSAFLNEHTAWYRPFNPSKTLMWQQKIEVRKGNRKSEVGLKGTIQGMSFEKDPTNGVGGPCKYFFHEEAGIAPKMNDTFEYIRPALKSGFITSGMFIAAGSVGDLDQCEPLKEMILKPEVNDIYAVESNLIDKDGTHGKSGLFIPEQWSMPPFIDNYGNSKVEEALVALEEQFATWKKELPADKYQLRISQHPRNIEEAFAYRKESKFPQHLVNAQIRRILDKEISIEYVNLIRDEHDKVVIKETRKLPINEFPVPKNAVDKEGVVVIYERPVKDPSFGMYYASIDPVGEGKTTTSDSLCSIFVYKAPTEVTKVEADTVNSYVEGDKIVASWCGRFDDIKQTHERLENIIEFYNAWTLVENNVSLFIQYMMMKRKQKYLVPKDQILFLKEITSNKAVYADYGWKNTGTLFKSHLLSYAIEYLQEKLDEEIDEDGNIVRTKFGVERIPDIMLLREMQAYRDGLNVDRLVAFSALVAFAKIQQTNRGYVKRVIRDDGKLEKSDKLSKFNNSPFRHMGKSVLPVGMKRSPFKNFK
jgi:hypothetical protein